MNIPVFYFWPPIGYQGIESETLLIFGGGRGGGVPAVKPRASHMLSKCSATEPHPQPNTLFWNVVTIRQL
jgi:hypothetical protein